MIGLPCRPPRSTTLMPGHIGQHIGQLVEALRLDLGVTDGGDVQRECPARSSRRVAVTTTTSRPVVFFGRGAGLRHSHRQRLQSGECDDCRAGRQFEFPLVHGVLSG
jgi:hypothetical protein